MSDCLNGAEHKATVGPPVYCSVCNEDVFTEFSEQMIAQHKSRVAMIKELRELHPVDVMHPSQQGLECSECYVRPPCPTRALIDKYEEKRRQDA